MKNIINYSGGVQSTTLVLASLIDPQIERADAAIMADTGWERQSTYSSVEWLVDFVKRYDFPIYFAKNHKFTIRDHILAETESDDGFLHIPTYTTNPFVKSGRSKGKKQCTNHFKIAPIRRKLKELIGESYTQWFGISLDEITRMSPSPWKSVKNRYPLVEQRWDRDMCIEWLSSHGFSVPTKSSCVGCPLHNTDSWQSLSHNEKKDAIYVDNEVRKIKSEVKEKQVQFDEDQLLLTIDISKQDLQTSMEPNYLHWTAKPLEDCIDENYTMEYDSDIDDCGGSCFL